MLTHFSLFSGIGGLDLAAEWAGFKTVGQCEWADYPTKVLEKHWPDVPRWRDIQSVTAQSFYERTGLRTVTAISGGFPCQPFSTAGKRKGKEDDRYLWPAMFRVVSELQPTWAIGENVAGIVSMVQPFGEIEMETETAVLKNFEMVLETIRKDFERIGYESQPILIPACAVGARHRRDRIAIMAWNTNSRDRDPRSIDQVEERKNAESSGICEDVSDPNEIRCDLWGYQGQRVQRKNQTCNEVDTCSEDVSDPNNQGLQGWISGGVQKCTGKRSFGESGSPISNTNSLRMEGARTEQQTARISGSSKDVADAESERCREARDDCKRYQERAAGSCIISNTTEELREWDRRTRNWRTEFTDGSWWDIEPAVGRVADGVPNRVDRLKSLGNAVVRQQFYPIFQAIADIENGVIR